MFAHEKVLLLKELRKRRIKVEISNVRIYTRNDQRRTFEQERRFYLRFKQDEEEDHYEESN